MRNLVTALLTVVILSSCASLTPGISTESDVVARYGQPVEQRRLPDGSRELDYPGSPMGYENWRITIAPDGKVNKLEQLLDYEHFAQLAAGMSKEQVQRVLGRPAESNHYARLGEDVISWRYMEFSRRMFFNAHFDPSGRFKYSSKSEESGPLIDNEAP